MSLGVDKAVVIIDEAHNVEGVCRDAGSMELSLLDMVAMASDLCELCQVAACRCGERALCTLRSCFFFIFYLRVVSAFVCVLLWVFALFSYLGACAECARVAGLRWVLLYIACACECASSERSRDLRFWLVGRRFARHFGRRTLGSSNFLMLSLFTNRQLQMYPRKLSLDCCVDCTNFTHKKYKKQKLSIVLSL